MQAIILFLVCLLSISFNVAAQSRAEQDCVGAVKICDNTNFTVPISYEGNGNISDIPDGTTCLTNEENNSAWFYFDVDSSGEVVFMIAPLAQDDYDFAVYKANNCNEIINGDVNAVRCSYFAYQPNSLPPNNNPLTGLVFGATDTVSGITDSIFLAPLQVIVGERYYIVIDNFQPNGGGFNLDFAGSTAKFVTDTLCKDLDTLFMNINEVKAKKVFNVFPNPADKQVFIQTEDFMAIENIALYNLQGQQAQIAYTIKENTATLNISALAKGFYYVHISTSEGEVVMKKLVVN